MLATVSVRVWSAAILAFASATGTQNQPPVTAPARNQDRIRVGVELVTTPVTVRDGRGAFLSDLKEGDFDVYEDGVKQKIATFSLSHGGRFFNDAPTFAPSNPGIVLPPPRPAADTSGRVFLIFIDDAHLEPSQTPRVRELFGRIAKRLIHPGDMFGILSTGPSSLEFEMTYDYRRLDQAAKRIMGSGLSPSDILSGASSGRVPPEVRHRVHVAFKTAYDVVNNLAAMHDRRKAMIYVSNGYDLNPFADARAKQEKERAPEQDADAFRQQDAFSEADLVSQLSELTRAAVRANVSIYTIDPRGLTAGADISQPIDAVAYQTHVAKTQDTLRVLAEQTGGLAVVNSNDFDKALDRIDAETSDYYMIGYYPSNTNTATRRRKIEIKVARPDVDVRYRQEYSRR